MKKFELCVFLVLLFIIPVNVSAKDSGYELICGDDVNNYTSLPEAINGATTGNQCRVEIYEDVYMNKSIAINANYDIVIDGNGHTFTYASTSTDTWYTGQLFNVKANGSLKLLDVVIDGNNNYSFDIDSYNNDLSDEVKVSEVMKYVTPEKGKPNITANVINNAGTLFIEDSVIKNIYTTKGISIIGSGSNSSTTYHGSIVKHCASKGSGLIVNASGSSANIFLEGNTLIDDNFVASNGGIAKLYYGAVLTMNNGTISNTRSVNSNGVVSMTYGSGSKFIMNGGTIANNSGVKGINNGRNCTIYIHSSSKFIMNGGLIENNSGTSVGGVDAPGHDTSGIELNGGVIQNNSVNSSIYNSRSDVSVQNDYNLVIGTDMIINGNIFVKGDIVNNGTINGQVFLDLTASNDVSTTITGTGSIFGDVYITYVGEIIPTINEDINIVGRQVAYEHSTEVVARFEFNGGVDDIGYDYDLVYVVMETGRLEYIPYVSREGYEFVGWYKDKELTEKWIEDSVSENVILYAKWLKIDNPDTSDNNIFLSIIICIVSTLALCGVYKLRFY